MNDRLKLSELEGWKRKAALYDAMVATPDPAAHAYTSTACYHGLHDRCRRECKFCSVACACSCHEEPTVAKTATVAEPTVKEEN